MECSARELIQKAQLERPVESLLESRLEIRRRVDGKDGGCVVRTVKDPEERRRELLEIAMQLFIAHGYENVSMRDIAHAAHVAPGLAYHYFDSKQKLFQAALDSYAAELTSSLIEILDEGHLTCAEKFDRMFDAMADESSMRYHKFFHAEGNRGFHDQLSLALCERMIPHLLAAIKTDAQQRGVEVANPESLVNFIAYGQIRLMSEHDIDSVREYVNVLLDSQTREKEQ